MHSATFWQYSCMYSVAGTLPGPCPKGPGDSRAGRSFCVLCVDYLCRRMTLALSCRGTGAGGRDTTTHEETRTSLVRPGPWATITGSGFRPSSETSSSSIATSTRGEPHRQTPRSRLHAFAPEAFPLHAEAAWSARTAQPNLSTAQLHLSPNSPTIPGREPPPRKPASRAPTC